LSDVNPSVEALRRLSAEQLVELLDRLDPADPALTELDIDAIAESIDPRGLSTENFARLLAQLDRLADNGGDVDFARMRSQTFARIVTGASSDQLQEIMVRPKLRKRVLDEIFGRMGRHFRADRAGSTTAVVHWRFSESGDGGGDYDRYETIIENGACVVNAGRTRDARVTITLPPADFLRLITRNASGPVLFMTGKLRIKGDLAFAAGLAGLFDLPQR
jgi:hypothetical protein